MDITTDLKKRFCKNANIPINLFEEPFFTDRLELFDKQYDSMRKYSFFIGELEKYGSEQEYFEHYNGVKDTVISAIKSTDAYKRFNTMDFSAYDFTVKQFKDITACTVYKPTNAEKTFVSIDMKSANFSALRYFDPTMFDNCETWEEFLSKFTDDKALLESKYIRQVILGNCNPSRHITYEKYIMCKLLERLSKKVPLEKVVCLAADEIIFEKCDEAINIGNIVNNFSEEYGIEFKVEVFTLYKMDGDLGYIKSYKDGKFKLKCVDSDFLPMILRLIQHGEISKSDMVFCYKDTLAIFKSPPKSVIESEIIGKLHDNILHKDSIKILTERIDKYCEETGNATIFNPHEFAKYLLNYEGD